MPDFTRLKSILIGSGVQQQNSALYQVIDTLLTYLGNIPGTTVGSSMSSGSSGSPGPIGPMGPMGFPGIGIDGFDGVDGSQGDKGDTGSIGPTGATGATGASGSAGLQGLPGLDGINGSENIEFSSPPLPTQTLDLISNTQGAVLYREGNQWLALAPGTSGYFFQTLGNNANPVWASVPTSIGLAVISTVVTSTTINTLNSAPLTLVSAPGANKIIEPLRIFYYVSRTTSTFSADPSFRIRWNGITTDLFSSVSFFLTTASAGNTFRDLVRTDINFGYGGSDPTNLSLQLSTSADTTGGTGTLRCSVMYYIADWS